MNMDSTINPGKRMNRKANDKDGLRSTNQIDMSTLTLLDEQNGLINDDKLNKVQSTDQELEFSVTDESKLYHIKGAIMSFLEAEDYVKSGPASSSRLAQKEGNSLELCKHNHTALSLVVDDSSSKKSSAEFSEERPRYVERVLDRKVEPFSHQSQRAGSSSIGDPYLKPMEKKNENFENELEQAVGGSFVCGKKIPAESQSERKHPFSDVEEIKHVTLAVVNKVDNFVKVSHPSLERALVNCSRRKLLVLDVNGLLADIFFTPPKGYKADINISKRAIFKRPFCYDFLKFCFERFDVGIWSSRSKTYLVRVVEYLLGDLNHKLLFCWDSSYCTKTGFNTLENRHKPLSCKELRKIWEKHYPNLPWEKGDYNESNTLLLDDSPYKALLNPMHTAIFPYSYSFKDRSDNSLGPGGDLRVYLENLATAVNIQEYVEQHPFGQSAINETSSSWDFYSRVLCSWSLVSTVPT